MVGKRSLLVKLYEYNLRTVRHIDWANLSDGPVRRYTCGWCGTFVASTAGLYGTAVFETSRGHYANDVSVLICLSCARPTFFAGVDQFPQRRHGRDVEHLPEQVAKAYAEARDAFAAGAYTASVLMARKLVMNTAVALGAEENKTFAYYVGWLSDGDHLPKNAKPWIDNIRQIGNQATHEIPDISETDAERLIDFCGIILTIVFENPGRLPAPPAEAGGS